MNELILVYIGIGFVSVLAFILVPKYIKDKELFMRHLTVAKTVFNFVKSIFTKK